MYFPLCYTFLSADSISGPLTACVSVYIFPPQAAGESCLQIKPVYVLVQVIGQSGCRLCSEILISAVSQAGVKRAGHPYVTHAG